MKKFIFTIAFAMLSITSSMASKADTLRIYTIAGTQKRCDRDSYHHHYHTACRQASPSLSDQGQRAGTD